MKIIFNKHTGEIYRAISKEQKIETLYFFYDSEFVKKLDEVIIDNIPLDLENYYIKDGQLVKHTEQEIEEKRLYGRILTEEERLLNKLKPTPKEVQKAENTIEILTLIQEVI